MFKRRCTQAALVAASSGLAIAQPTIDGVYDSGTESGVYGAQLWVQNTPTQFGDNEPGEFTGGDFGEPVADVMTGVEICIPLADLGDANFRLAGWVNSGDRTFLSNQIIHDGNLPIDTPNLGNAPDFSMAPFDGGNEYIDVAAPAGAAPVVDGMLDASYGAPVFSQTNFTGFGDNNEPTDIGGGGSEIDAVYAINDGVSLYLFIAGNLEANGNGLDLYFDTDSNGATGDNVLGFGGGDGAFIVDAQNGLAFDAGFGADFVLSVDAWNDDMDDGTTPNVPRIHAGPIGGSIDDIGSLAGYGAANAGSVGSGYSLGINNSNVLGVIGSPSQASPVSPDANWAYGSEICNVRAGMDENNLYIFIGGNIEINSNKLNLFIDAAPGGQNTLRTDNIDISFNGLNNMGGLIWDAGFAPDYWLNANFFVDGGTGELNNFADCAVLRTDGPIFDPFFILIADYGTYSGGPVTDGVGAPVMDPYQVLSWDGVPDDRFDEQDGFLSSLFSNWAPRASAELGLDILQGFASPGDRPMPGLVQLAIDSSNVAGVTAIDAMSPSADGAAAVNTGIELCIDLDELGWDGKQDILLGGYITDGGFGFMSNQVFGGLPLDGSTASGFSENLETTSMVDFSMIDGDQFVNLSAEGMAPCVPDFNPNPPGVLAFNDVVAFLTAFSNGDPSADLAGNGNGLDFNDVIAFLTLFSAGCP